MIADDAPPDVPRDLLVEMGEAVSDAFGPGARWSIVRAAPSASRRNYLVEVEVDDETGLVWCRATEASIDEAFGDRYRLAAEAGVLQSLHSQGISVPRILGRSRAGRAFVQQFVGTLDGDGAESPEAVTAYLRALDAVHRLDATSVFAPSVPGMRAVAADEAARIENRAWIALADRLLTDGSLPRLVSHAGGLGGLDARIDAIRALMREESTPPWPEPVTVVHGDAGRANFVQDATGEVWLLDWELAHPGSRLEDYAWCELRGLEQNSSTWMRNVLERLVPYGARAAELYGHARTLIYFRAAVATSARLAADPSSELAPYLARRLCENEWLGWLSAIEHRRVADLSPVATPEGVPAGDHGLREGSNARLAAWTRWTDALRSLAGHRPQPERTPAGTSDDHQPDNGGTA